MLSLKETLSRVFGRPADSVRPRREAVRVRSPYKPRPLRLECLEERTLLCNPGELDVTFSGDGKLTDDFGTEARSVMFQSGGKMVVTGKTTANSGQAAFGLTRYNTDGGLDKSFGSKGRVKTTFGSGSGANGSLWDAALQADGKIVAVGGNSGNGYQFAIARYTSNGALDTTFDADGKATTDLGPGADEARAVAIQADGKIVVVGETTQGSQRDFAVARYNTNGSLDVTFGVGGKVITSLTTADDRAYDVAIQTDGRIVVTGGANFTAGGNQWDFALVRYNSDGSLDTSFDGDGQMVIDFDGPSNATAGQSVVIQPDQKIVVALPREGLVNTDFALMRFNADGSMDNTFDGDGLAILDVGGDAPGQSVTIQADGRLVVAGGAGGGLMGLARFNADGSADTSFGTGGAVTTDFDTGADPARAVAIDPNGKIVAVGQSGISGSSTRKFAVARYCS